MKRCVILILLSAFFMSFLTSCLDSGPELNFSNIPYGVKLGCSYDKLLTCDTGASKLPDGQVIHNSIDSSKWGYAEGVFSAMISYDIDDKDSLRSVTVHIIYGNDSILAKDTSLFQKICEKMTEKYGRSDDDTIKIIQTWHDEDTDITVIYYDASESANHAIFIKFETHINS